MVFAISEEVQHKEDGQTMVVTGMPVAWWSVAGMMAMPCAAKPFAAMNSALCILRSNSLADSISPVGSATRQARLLLFLARHTPCAALFSDVTVVIFFNRLINPLQHIREG